VIADREVEYEVPLPVATAITDAADAPAVQRVADLVVTDLSARRSEYVDLSIPCPQASRYLPGSARCRGAAARSMRQLKESQYAASLLDSTLRDSALSYRFVPLIIECFGLVDSVGSRWLRGLFRNSPSRLDSLLTELSLTLWRSNAALLSDARHQRLVSRFSG